MRLFSARIYKQEEYFMDNNVSWMFFNCDSYTTWASMNPLYNCYVYRKRAGRRALWREIKKQVREENILIDTKDMPKVRDEILFGNPVNATGYMTYGAIIDLEEVR